MPELPDLAVYVEALRRVAEGRVLEKVRLNSPFVLRTAEPPYAAVEGRRVVGVRRVGKRLVLDLEGDLHVAIHLMIAGRLAWKEKGAKIAGRSQLAAFDLESGTLVLTEASSKQRAAIHVLADEAALRALDAGGVEPLEVDLAGFAAALRRDNRTLKRALTSPDTFAGIGNAYSDEILHRARLAPTQLTGNLDDAEVARLHAAARAVLEGWTAKLRAEVGDGWPTKVTAFREGMAVHGRYGLPCPDCGAPVQRIVRGEHETDYCARCQTGGKLLADRALSKILHDDWPKTLDAWEETSKRMAAAERAGAAEKVKAPKARRRRP